MASAAQRQRRRFGRRIHPEWFASNGQTSALRSKISTMVDSYSKLPLEEPTEAMLLASYLSLQKTLPAQKAAIRGNIRRIVGSVDSPLAATDCCMRSCPLGRFVSLQRQLCLQVRRPDQLPH